MTSPSSSLVTSSASLSSCNHSSAAVPVHNSHDLLYRYDANAMAQMRRDRPWDKDVKHFKYCRLSALAAMKMLKHALSGVEKGRQLGQAPLEIMGLMIGKAVDETIVVLDSCPLPVQGSETRVVADDAQVHMTELVDSLELRRHDGFIGWYHSHPFDLESYSHCHLSATDVQTQTIWQNSSPTWIALVIDPLRSLFKQEPEFGVYRVYPPSYTAPVINECPDGQIVADSQIRTTRWGVTYHRYYSLEIQFFLGELGSNLLDTMSRNNLWIRVLASNSSFAESEARGRVSDRVSKLSERLAASESQVMSPSAFVAFSSSKHSSKKRTGEDALAAITASACDTAVEQCKCHASLHVRERVFALLLRQEYNSE